MDNKLIFLNDPYEQAVVAANDVFVREAEKREEEDRRRRVEQGDAKAMTLSSPIQFFGSEKEVAVAEAYEKIYEKYAKNLAPGEKPVLIPMFGATSCETNEKPYIVTPQRVQRYNTAEDYTYPGSTEKRYTPIPTATDLLEKLLSSVNLKRDGDAIYSFDGICYNRLNDNEVNTLISSVLSKELKISGSANQLSNVYTLLKAEGTILDQPIDQSIFLKIAVKNGLLDRRSFTLYRANPNDFVTSKINVCWNPNNVCPMFDNFLLTCAGGDLTLLQRLWEFVAFSLIPNRIKRIALLQGVGDSGKTQLTALLESFFDNDKVSHRDIHRLGDRFSLFDLVDKRLNISADLPAGSLSSKAVAVLKQISGNDTITVEEKYHNPRKAKLSIKLIIVSNHALSLQYYDQQFANRILLIPFFHAVPPKQQDYMLLEKLKTEREGILAKAVRVFNQLEANNFIFSGDEMYTFEKQAISNVPIEANTIQQFISDCCELKAGFTPTATLHNRYLTYCASNGYPAINDRVTFSKQLSIAYGNVINRKKQRVGGEAVNGYEGIMLKGGV